MSKIEVFDPPMCCSTGICGPEVDPTLIRVTADLKMLQDRGVEVRRFNLAQEPTAFTRNPDVKRVLDATDGDGLPIVVVDGRMVSQGEYPSRQRLMELAGLNEAGPANVDVIQAVDVALCVKDQPAQVMVRLAPKHLLRDAAPADGRCGGGDGCC